MKKNNKIRSKVVKESLLDYNNLANTLKENTTAAVRDLLSEAVRDTYSKILMEEDEKDYDVEEVDDTDSETDADEDVTADDSADAEGSDDVTDDAEATEDIDTDNDGEIDDAESEEGVDDEGALTGETSASGEDEDGDEWSEFDKYKVSDDEYDFSNAEDDEIVKVYKLLNNDDQVIVNKTDDNKVSIKDNEAGTEYLVDLGCESEGFADDDTEDFGDEDGLEEGNDFSADDDADLEDEDDFDNEEDDMNESRIYEIALDEYDSHVGYTDNYQSKSPLDTKGLKVADDKDKNDWGSKGLKDRGDSKPWSGKKNNASENQPLTGAKGKTVEEEDEIEGGDANANIAESAGEMGERRGAKARMVGIKFHRTNSSGNRHPYGQHHVSTAGEYEGDDNGAATNESIIRKANKIFTENKELKQALGKFKNVLEEAAVTNLNLGQIIKLISENTTTQNEKKEIIARFGKEAKTVEQSKNLYESISRDLKKKDTMNLDESRQYNVEGSKQINETQIYQSKDLIDSLDLMHRLCK
jgi:hypothetical protein